MLKLFKTEKPMSIYIYAYMCVCMPTVLRSVNKYKTFVDM